MDLDILREKEIMCRELEFIMEEEFEKLLMELEELFIMLPENFSLRNDADHVLKKSEKYMLANPNLVHAVKCMVTLAGNAVQEADLALRLPKNPNVIYQSRIYSDKPWKMQQIQDSVNQMKAAQFIINSCHVEVVRSSQQLVINTLDNLMYHIRSSKECLTLPRRKTLEELVKNPQNRCFNPSLPNEVVSSFYLQGDKLTLAVYYLFTNQSGRVDISNRQQTDSVVPWLTDVLYLMTLAFNKCQQLKDKLTTLENLKYY